jgi:sugar/nucleoside kinase (ribokinase family)
MKAAHITNRSKLSCLSSLTANAPAKSTSKKPHMACRIFPKPSSSTLAAASSSGFDFPIANSITSNEDHHNGFDVLGLGQAMIDYSVPASDDFLHQQLDVPKGARKIICLEERARVLELLQNSDYSIASGGSLSNTLIALARLGAAGADIRIAMAGLIGGDALGAFYTAQMASAGVDVISPLNIEANTGTVVVVTSQQDAQRTMLSYLGTPAAIPITTQLKTAIANSKIIVIEGYLWELPDAQNTIIEAINVAREAGTIIAMTVGDAGVAERHGAGMWTAIEQGVDLLFSNKTEAKALLASIPQSKHNNNSNDRRNKGALDGCRTTTEATALALAPHCPIVVVTDGSHGSIITALGQLHVVPPHWGPSKPIDTCGAGDAYCAGMLWGLLRSRDVVSMGRAGARVASAVIARQGGTLSEEAAQCIVEEMTHSSNSSGNDNGDRRRVWRSMAPEPLLE